MSDTEDFEAAEVDVLAPLPAYRGRGTRWHKVGKGFIQPNGDVHVYLDSVPVKTDEYGRVELVVKRWKP